jgi:hypothetical protein
MQLFERLESGHPNPRINSQFRKFLRNEIALLDKPAVAPISQSVITFENYYNRACAIHRYSGVVSYSASETAGTEARYRYIVGAAGVPAGHC